MTQGKGSARRPTTLTQDELARAWERTFTLTRPYDDHNPEAGARAVRRVPEAEVSTQDGDSARVGAEDA